jgi:hypothetical protein
MKKAMMAFMTATAAFTAAACSARYELSMLKGGAADMGFSVNADKGVMESMAEKAAMLTDEDTEGKTLAFDLEGIKTAFSGRKDMKLVSLEKSSETGIKGKANIPDISALGTGSEKGPSFFTYSESKGTATLSFRLERGNAADLTGVLVGLDRNFLELLAPPALYGDDLSEAEYEQALLPFIGKKDMPAFKTAQAEFKILPPGKILSSKGGRIEGNAFIVTIFAMQAMVLEKPIEFSLSWKI